MIALIWAQAAGRVIGKDGAMPWHLPEDLKHFRDVTCGHSVVMGRKTWDSLPEKFRPLPGRDNIVVTRNDQWHAEGAQRAGSLDEALAAFADDDTVFVMGGGELYSAAMELAADAYVTDIDIEVDGDTYAPTLNGHHWRIETIGGWQRSTTGLRYRFVHYRRR